MLSPPSSWQPMDILVSLLFFPFRRPYSKHALFSDWLVFLSNTHSQFLHTGWWIIYHFFLSTESSCPLFQCSPLICPFTYGKTFCLLPVLEILKRLLQLSTHRQTNSKVLLVTPTWRRMPGCPPEWLDHFVFNKYNIEWERVDTAAHSPSTWWCPCFDYCLIYCILI